MDVEVGIAVTIFSGILIAAGIVGTIVPVLPGVLFCWLGVLIWAIFGAEGWSRWVVLGVASAIAAVGIAAQYAWPGKRMKQAGVPNKTLIIGGLFGIVGFFVLPLFGLPIGFVLGVWLAEQARLREGRAAWESTKHALKAAGLYMLIELASAFGIAIAWVVGLIAI